jgi:pSer/pThr/pTyr-binding forkhead associated (FHA) protein/RNA polymerase subunit RPABC4/transcription elongation factor Spt4
MDVGLVCDACSALTPIGVPQCARCGQPVALDPRAKRATIGPPAPGASGPATFPAGTASGESCNKCGAVIPPNFKFCPSCGNKMIAAPPGGEAPSEFDVQTRVGPRQPDPAAQKIGRSTMFFGGAMQAARAKLTLIRGDGEDGVAFTLAGTDHLAGRGDCPISFPDDTFLSPTHANFRYSNNQLIVRDEGSLNGVYVRIAGSVTIKPRSTILVGEQVLTIQPARVADDVPDGEGTYYSATMTRTATMEIVQQLRGGTPGWVFRVDTEVVSLGRESNDINFPDDPFISGRHAQIQFAQGVLTVTDVGSRNGTFVRVVDEAVLKHGDYVFLGQQLLRVEIV